MLFTRLAAFALPVLGALASPIARVETAPAVQKRGGDILQTLLNLQNEIGGPVAQIVALNGASVASGNEVNVCLNDIANYINLANLNLGSVVQSRDLAEVEGLTAIEKLGVLAKRADADELEQVGEGLAAIVGDITGAIEGLVDEVKKLPIVAPLITRIQGGLSTILFGVDLVLVGVIQVVNGLLGGLGLGGLLGGLGNGLGKGLLDNVAA